MKHHYSNIKTGVRPLLITAACVLLTGSIAHATIITNTSANFSIGLGYVDIGGGVGAWNTSETSGSNTPTTQGNFSFTTTVVSRKNSNNGPSFPGRTLSNGDGTNLSGNGGISNPSPISAFTNVVTASWNGGVPADAAPNPNFQLQLNITSIRLWVNNFDGSGNPFGFREITIGNTSVQSPLVTDPAGGSINTPANFTQLIWDPADFIVAGTNSTRTFILTAGLTGLGNVSDLQIDGFEVFGNVQMTYEFIPEPSTVALLASGGLLLWRRTRKRHI